MGEPQTGLSRRRVLQLAGATAVVAACGPAGTPGQQQRQAGGTIRIAIGIDPDTLDPQGQTTTTVANIVDYVVETLVKYDGQGKVQPSLAERWEAAADGRSFTFHLRKGVTFHDGTPFNAKAVQASFTRVLNPQLRVPTRNPVGLVLDRVDEVSEHVARFVLKSTFPAFVSSLASTSFAVASPKSLEGFATTYNEEPVGTGPYKFRERKRGEQVTLTRHDGYWGRKPHYDTVVFRVVPEAPTRLSLLLANQAEIIILPPVADIPTLQRNSAVKVLAGESNRTIFLAFNNQREILRDRRVRQALNHAVDKDAIIKNVMFGLADKMDSPTAPSLFGHCKTGSYAFDQNRARQLLREAGQERMTLKMGYPTGRYVQDRQAGEAIAGFLREVGVTVEATTSDWPTYLASINVPPDRATFDTHLLGWAPAYLDSAQQFDLFGGQTRWPPRGLATSYYENARVTELIAQASAETNDQRRAQAWCDAQKQVHEDAPFMFLWVQKFPIVHSAKIKNVGSIPTEKFDAVYAEPA